MKQPQVVIGFGIQLAWQSPSCQNFVLAWKDNDHITLNLRNSPEGRIVAVEALTTATEDIAIM